MPQSGVEKFARGAGELPRELRRRLRALGALGKEARGKQAALARRLEAAIRRRAAELGAGGSGRGDWAGPGPEMERELGAVLALHDRQLGLAREAYNLVDVQVRQLDKQLKQVEGALEKRAERLEGGGRGKGGPPGAWGIGEVRPPAGGGGEGTSEGEEADGDVAATPGVGVDPLEPTYCYCKGVSFGEMVGCENEDCKIGWFHLACVGLTPDTVPRGKWLCPSCR